MRDARKKSLWMGPVGWFLYAVILLLCMTIMVLLWKVKQRHAEGDFDRFVSTADAQPDPRESLKQYEAYVKSHRDNALTRRARQKVGETQERVATYDFEQTRKNAELAGEDYESAVRIWQAYLSGQPREKYRKQAEDRLQELPNRIDDRDFDRTNKQYPPNGPSLEARKAALEAYVSAHSQGRHVDAARKTIAQIPDLLDQRTYQALADEVASLVAASKIVEAIDCLDAKSTTISGQPRKDRLLRTRQVLMAELEQQDLQRILSAPLGEAAQQRSLLSACRLFVLSYPASKNAADVRKRMTSVVENLAISEWRSVQQTLDINSAKPDVCLHALDEYLQHWPEALSVESIRQAASGCYAKIFLSRFAGLVFPQTGSIIKKDGTSVTGIIDEKTDLYKVADPATGKVLPTVWKKDAESYTPSETSQAGATLRKQVAALDPRNPDKAALRAAAAMAKQHQFREAIWLLCSLLARIDGENTETQQLLEGNGFWKVGKRWLSQEDMSDSAILPRLVDQFGHLVVDGVKQTMQQLPLTVKFTRLGVDEKVQVDCAASLAGADLQSKMQDTSGLKASIRYRFTIKLQPQQQDLEDSKSVTQLVADIAAKAQCEAILEITEQRTSYSGVGLAVELRADTWVVSAIEAKGPAGSVWIEAGDVMLAVNGRILNAQIPQQELIDMLAGTAGEVELRLRRSNRTYTVKVSKSEWTTSVYQGRYYIRHNLNGAGVLQFLPPVQLPPASGLS